MPPAGRRDCVAPPPALSGTYSIFGHPKIRPSSPFPTPFAWFMSPIHRITITLACTLAAGLLASGCGFDTSADPGGGAAD